MNDAEILQAANTELRKLRGRKLWMTERALAKRLRRDRAFGRLDHVRLRAVLMDHAASRPRRIRNSSAPSIRTLEVLWGAIREGGVEEADIMLPLLTGGPARVNPEGRRGQSAFDEQEEPADYFLSYRMADEDDARAVIRAVESSGSSVWDAGSFIVEEEHINDCVREAMKSVRKQLIYLSTSALRSLWVNKEAIYGDHLELKQVLVLKGDDDVLMECVYRMLNGEDPQFPPYRGRTSQAVDMFRGMLQATLADANGGTVYLSPLPADGRWRAIERLQSIDKF